MLVTALPQSGIIPIPQDKDVIQTTGEKERVLASQGFRFDSRHSSWATTSAFTSHFLRKSRRSSGRQRGQRQNRSSEDGQDKVSTPSIHTKTASSSNNYSENSINSMKMATVTNSNTREDIRTDSSKRDADDSDVRRANSIPTCCSEDMIHGSHGNAIVSSISSSTASFSYDRSSNRRTTTNEFRVVHPSETSVTDDVERSVSDDDDIIAASASMGSTLSQVILNSSTSSIPQSSMSTAVSNRDILRQEIVEAVPLMSAVPLKSAAPLKSTVHASTTDEELIAATATQQVQTRVHQSKSSFLFSFLEYSGSSEVVTEVTRSSSSASHKSTAATESGKIRNPVQVLNQTIPLNLGNVTLSSETTQSSNGSPVERPATRCCTPIVTSQATPINVTESRGLTETFDLIKVPSSDFVGKAATSSVSGEIVAVSVGCILVFWVILGPIAYAIYRSRDKAKKARRMKDKKASAAVLEEIIRVELAKGRSRLYRTAVGDERELQRLSLDDYGAGNWQHHVELPSSHSLFRSAYLDSPLRTEPVDGLTFGTLNSQKVIGEAKEYQSGGGGGGGRPVVRNSFDDTTRTPEMSRKAYECNYNNAFVMGTEPRSRRYSTATKLPTMGSSASLQRRALQNLSSPTSDTGQGLRMTTSASVNQLTLHRQPALEPHIIGKLSSPDGNPLHYGMPVRMAISPTSNGFIDKPRFPIMGQASLVYGTTTHKAISSNYDRKCNSDVLQRRITPINSTDFPLDGNSFVNAIKKEKEDDVWKYQNFGNYAKLMTQFTNEANCLSELEDSAV